MFSPYILYFILVFPFLSILATPIVKQCFTSNYISPCGIPAHTFPQRLLTGYLCTKYLISTVPPAVYKITNNNLKKTQLLLPHLNLHCTQESLPDVLHGNRLWPTEHFENPFLSNRREAEATTITLR